MKPIFVATPSGQLVGVQHVVSLSVEGMGVGDQLRHEVQATLVTGEQQVLATFKGSDSHREANQFIATLLERAEVNIFNPRLS